MVRNAEKTLAVLVGVVLLTSPGSASVRIGDSPCELPALESRTAKNVTNGCLACHATIGTAIFVDGRCHPFSISYANSWSRGGFKALSPSSNVALAHGEVTCTSCHDPLSQQRNHIAGNPLELCQTCHAR